MIRYVLTHHAAMRCKDRAAPDPNTIQLTRCGSNLMHKVTHQSKYSTKDKTYFHPKLSYKGRIIVYVCTGPVDKPALVPGEGNLYDHVYTVITVLRVNTTIKYNNKPRNNGKH